MNDKTRPLGPQPPADAPPPEAREAEPPPSPPNPPPTPVRERRFGWRAVLAGTLAGLLVGGLSGAAIGVVLDGPHGPRPGPYGQHDRMPAPGPGGPGPGGHGQEATPESGSANS